MVTLDDLKSTNYGRGDAPVYKVLRRISIRLSIWCIKWNVSPNVVTFFSFVTAVISATLLTGISTENWKFASMLLLLSFILDCMDGEIARGRNKSSILGIQLEHIFHWLITGILQAGVTIGAYNISNTWIILLLGFMSIIGWYSFYFLYLQLRVWVDPSASFSLLRSWSRLLFKVMPLDENLLIIFAFTGHILLYLWISGVLSICLFSTTLALYLYYGTRKDAHAHKT